jgi:hypothetical protein
MKSIRVMALGGLLSSALVVVGGFADIHEFIGIAGVFMAACNLYCMVKG